MSAKETIHLRDFMPQVLESMDALKDSFGAFETHESQQVDKALVASVLTELTDRLDNNFPYFHPQYAAQMLKPPHPVAMAAYMATMMINPNNHSIDGGRATAEMEWEVLAQLRTMFGYPEKGLGHLTWSGTTANLEALWVSREVNPGKAVAHSKDSHYTHSRMAEVLNVPSVGIAVESDGRMSLEALEVELKKGNIGVVVATLGTTGLGAVDPLADIIPLARQYGARVHVDTAYGGFFTLIPDELDAETNRHYAAIKDSDSVVVDPHKHGLQPYGCGAVLFPGFENGQYYKHDSPYTYFASKDLHFGEIQLECSRAGASAAALWATLKVFPLNREGLGAVIAPGRRAARQWHEEISQSDVLQPYQRPELDIVTYLPKAKSMSQLDEVSQKLFVMAADTTRPQQTHLATYVTTRANLESRGITMDWDSPTARIMRSVLMKPEQEQLVPEMHWHVQMWARRAMGLPDRA